MGEPGGSEGGGGTTTITTTTTTSDDIPICPVDLDPAVVATMTADELKKFIDTGRTGRRNALPDVTQPEVASTSTAGLAETMESLSMQSDKGNSSSGEPSGGS